MKAISATPEEVRKVFSGRYIIPIFQRPYSWDKEQCEKLWDDIVDFHSSKSAKDKYFLGNVVLHPSEEDENVYSVIDGQQRLTTLLLLIKALHSKAVTVTALEECLKIKDPLTAQLTNELRLNSLVLDGDKKALHEVILYDNLASVESNIVKNYIYFVGKIEEWLHSYNNSAEAFNKLILSLLDSIVLLPIHCESEDDALTIFETINNRGMSLSDADIFKSTLYANCTSKQAFIDDWNSLEDHENLFRILMHIRRAEKGDTSKEIALRSFFNSKSGYLNDVGSVMTSLKIINSIEHSWSGTAHVNILWDILVTYPNYYWKYPLFVFLNKYGAINADGDYELQLDHVEEFNELITETVIYFFIKSVVYNSVNTVKDTTFRVCAAIAAGEKYLAEYEKNIGNDRIQFFANLESSHLGRCQRGIILLAAYLNPRQNHDDFAEAQYQSGFHIEHILPQKWADNNDWDKSVADEKLNTLGNLIPFEKKLNISATNAFFGKKKDHYKHSKVQDALDLLALQAWTPMEVEASQNEKLNRLSAFFRC